ncbi:MAG: ABC transporter permease, partial [Rhizobiales bacterium]|nr:ABC transporter permease [Hyphomicrobiales bacterium]
LALIACLALKEIPFLIAMMWSVLAQGDLAPMLTGHWRSARSLGHGTGSVWLRVLLPQILTRLGWPIAAVWIYGATVVDMALVIGPTQPPTLAVIAWADLNNASEDINGRGSAGAMVLTLVLFAVVLLAYLTISRARKWVRGFMTAGPSALSVPKSSATLLAAAIIALYGFVLVTLAAMSLSGRWPYPQLLPETIEFVAWQTLLANGNPAILSLSLALATSATALGFVVWWFETVEPRFDRVLTIAAIASLGPPALAVASGQYRVFLHLDLIGTPAGLYLAHFTLVFAYVFIVLKGPYRAFDPRFRAVAHGLNAGKLRFWLRVKAPLLKAPLATAAAIGFSVGVVQFVPAQLIAAGRYSTLPMEAVTLASGGHRPLTAAYALALALLPAIAFLLALVLGHPRWRQAWT